MSKFIDLTGKRFGRLLVISNYCMGKRRRWNCLCDCGKTSIVGGENLSTGHTQSCGCLGTEKRTIRKTIHGFVYHPLYIAWKNIKARCYYEKCMGYKWYGARGIIMCDEWLNNAELFIKWCFDNGWSPGLEIDRKDNDGNYTPDNCHFITHQANCLNRRNCKSKNNVVVEDYEETKAPTIAL